MDGSRRRSHPQAVHPRARSADAELVGLLARAAGATSAVIDERYTVTAIIVEREVRGLSQTVLVELLDAGPEAGAERWLAIAYDDLRGVQTPSPTAATVAAVIERLDWSALDPEP